MRSVCWILMALSLAACVPSAQQIAEHDDATCRSYGLEFGTANYATCRHSLASERQAYRAAAIQNRPQVYTPPLGLYPMQTGPSGVATTTNCQQMGAFTQCQSR